MYVYVCQPVTCYSPIEKETLGVSRVRHGLRTPSKASVRDSRPGLSITAA